MDVTTDLPIIRIPSSSSQEVEILGEMATVDLLKPY